MLSLIDTDEVKSLFTLRAATDEKLTENAGIEKGKQEEGTKEREGGSEVEESNCVCHGGSSTGG